jgi:hypothetical protein
MRKCLYTLFHSFGETPASFSTKSCSSVIVTKWEAIWFCPQANSARISRAEQLDKYREKYYPPPEYMLNCSIYMKRYYRIAPYNYLITGS